MSRPRTMPRTSRAAKRTRATPSPSSKYGKLLIRISTIAPPYPLLRPSIISVSRGQSISQFGQAGHGLVVCIDISRHGRWNGRNRYARKVLVNNILPFAGFGNGHDALVELRQNRTAVALFHSQRHWRANENLANAFNGPALGGPG